MKYLLKMLNNKLYMKPERVEEFKKFLDDCYTGSTEFTQDERDIMFDTWNYQQDIIEKLTGDR